MEILTFRDWKEQHVKVFFDLDNNVKVTSFDNTIIDVKDNVIFNDLYDKQITLYRYFRKNFDSIQKTYKKTIGKVKTN